MYALRGGTIIRLNPNGSETSIPNDLGNVDYRDYLDWLAQGNTPIAYADPNAAFTAGTARTTRIEARTQAQAQKLARKGDTLGALKLLNNL